MKKIFVMAAWLCVLALIGSPQRSFAQTPDQTTTDKTSQLANDFCTQLSLAQASGQTTTDKTSQLANDFCAQLSLAQASGQPVQLALAQTSSEPTRLALAQTPGQQPTDRTVQVANDLHFTVGYRAWFNSWTTPGKVRLGGIFGAIPLETTSDAIGSIPTVGVRYKDFFVSASGFFANDYTADLIRLGNVNFDQHSKRREADVNVGYYIHPWIALSAGYKHIGMDVTIQGIPSNLFEASYRYNGPTLGAAVSIPIPEGGLLPSGLTVYGNGAGGYLWTHGNTQNGASLVSNHAFYSVLEGGLAYKIPNLPVAFTGGYKFQAVNTHYKSQESSALGGKNSGTDVMRGPILGVSYIR